MAEHDGDLTWDQAFADVGEHAREMVECMHRFERKWLPITRGGDMNRDSIMFSLKGIDGTTPWLVARTELIEIFAGMANSDLIMAHTQLYELLPKHIDSTDYWGEVPAKDLISLMEYHMRALNAVKVLLSLREPDELVEAHMP